MASRLTVVIAVLAAILIATGAAGGHTHTTATVCETPDHSIDVINACAAQELAPVDEQGDVNIAIIDTGVNGSHPALRRSVVWGARTTPDGMVYGEEALVDDDGHGTSVAGVAVGDASGVAPNANLYYIDMHANNAAHIALRGPDGEIGTEDDADVISMSFTGGVPASRLEAFQLAHEHDVPLVTGSGYGSDGNLSTNDLRPMEKTPFTITVTPVRTGRRMRALSASASGEEIDLSSPGVTHAPSSEGGRRRVRGGSFAAPHVAGVLALMIAQDRADGSQDYGPRQLELVLEETSQDLGDGYDERKYGAGLLDAEAAVQYVDRRRPPDVPTPEPTATPSPVTNRSPTETPIIRPTSTIGNEEGGSTPLAEYNTTSTSAPGFGPVSMLIVVATLVLVYRRRLA